MNRRRVNVRGIIYKNGLLFAVRQRGQNGAISNYLAIPGGGLDVGESLESGLRREIIEELGIEPIISRLLFVQQFKSDRVDCDEEMEFFFCVENVDDFETVDLSRTTHGQEEIAEYGFYDPKKENILPDFLQTINLENYIANVRPVYNIYYE